MNHIKVYEDEVRKYGVDNIYKDITNSDVIYYVTSNYSDKIKKNNVVIAMTLLFYVILRS